MLATVYRYRHALIWFTAAVCFVLGFYVGWTINANLGAALWGASAVLAFLPFLSHRNQDQP